MSKRLMLLGLLLLPTTVVSAHPGHGIDGGSHEMTHYLSDPLHLGILVGVMAVSLLCVHILRSRLTADRPQHD